MKAKTQVEFAKAWSRRVDSLIACFPQDEDLFKFSLAQGHLKQIILRKARSLSIPRGDSLEWAELIISSGGAWAELMIEHEEPIK